MILLANRRHACSKREGSEDMHYTKKFFDEILQAFEEQMRENETKIEDCQEGSLWVEAKNGKEYLVLVKKDPDGRRVRRRIGSDQGTVDSLLRKEYLRTQNEVLARDVEILRFVAENFLDTSAEEYVKHIPSRLSGYAKEMIVAGYKPHPWENEPYEKSDYRPEGRFIHTSRGLDVRSKSEALIAEQLYKFDVPFRYEQVLHFGERKLVPDFTVLNRRTGKEFFWEHCGLVNNRKYLEHHNWKISVYEGGGITPWDNLIVTYDSVDGEMNVALVESEIRNKLL